MDEPATFDEGDWADLTSSDKKALKTLDRYGFGNISPEPLARAAGVGQPSVDALISKGLAVEDEPGLHGRYFKLTEKGVLATCWINGSQVRVFPR